MHFAINLPLAYTLAKVAATSVVRTDTAISSFPSCLHGFFAEMNAMNEKIVWLCLDQEESKCVALL